MAERIFVCAYCGDASKREAKLLTRSGKVGAMLFCSRRCFALARRRRADRTIIEERFWSKVNKTEGCWLWTGAVANRYGQFRPHRTEPIQAHRFSYILSYGEISNDIKVLHECDVTLCVKPEHLFLGTQRDNVADMIAKGRAGWQKAIQRAE